MSKLLATPIKYEIVHLMKNGETSRNTAEIVNQKFRINIHHSSVNYIHNKFVASGNVINQWNSKGRPKKFDERDARVLINSAIKNRQSSSFELANSFSKTIAPSTVRRILVRNGLKSRTAMQKYTISPNNIKKRMKFASDHKFWSKEDWMKVCFSDESRFELCSSGKVKLRMRVGEKLKLALPKEMMGGGSVMVWGLITPTGVGPLVKVEGTMDSEKYQKLLGEEAMTNFQIFLKMMGLFFKMTTLPPIELKL